MLLSAYVCEPGGGSEHKDGWLWAQALARRYDVTLLTDVAFHDAVEAALAVGDGPRLRRVYLDVSAHTTPLHPLFDVFPHYYAWQRRALAVARELHAREPFDVVQHVTYGSHRLPTYLGRLGVPLLWGPLGGGERVRPTFYSPRWLGAGQSAREGMRLVWNAACRFDPRLRETARQATVIAVATTATVRAYPRATRRKGVVMAKTAVDANELALLADLPARPGPRDGLSVVFAGRLLGWKGPSYALHAFGRYARGFPAAELHFYGDGPLRARLERDARRLRLGGRVTFHGRVRRADLLGAYARHHVLLFPSLHDSYPATVIEAMAAGVPVVCLDAGGTAVSVPDGVGCKVTPHSPRQVVRDLAAALASLTTDERVWRRASERARSHAVDGDATATVDGMIDRLYGAAGLIDVTGGARGGGGRPGPRAARGTRGC